MKLIQPALIVFSLLLMLFYFKYFRSMLFDRIIAFICFFAIIVAVLLPDLTTQIANFLDVGRGTDLVFYVYVIFSLFVFALLYSKHVATDSKLTSIVRRLAILHAEKPKNKS